MVHKQKTNTLSFFATFFAPQSKTFPAIIPSMKACRRRSHGNAPSSKEAQQILLRSFKYLKYYCEDEEEELNCNMFDFSLSSPDFLFRFVDAMQSDWGLGRAGRLAYSCTADFVHFRNTHYTPDSVQYNKIPRKST